MQIIILIQTKAETMRETIPQKIERLERTITNLKNEEKELKKGKRLLSSEVRTLKKQMERTDRNHQIQMEKEISLLQSQITELQNTHSIEIGKYRSELDRLYSNNASLKKIVKERRDKIAIEENKIRWKAVLEFEESLRYSQTQYDREALEAYQSGLMKYDSLPFFASWNLLIQINPKTGKWLKPIDMIPILDAVSYEVTYKYEMERYIELKKTDISKTELEEYVYKKGKELLRIYANRIY